MKRYFALFAILVSLAVYAMGDKPAGNGQSTDSGGVISIESLYSKADMAIEAIALNSRLTNGSRLLVNIKPTKIWKGDKSQVPHQIYSVYDCSDKFKNNVNYILLLNRNNEGLYGTHCFTGAFETKSSENLGFLKNLPFETLKN